MIERLTRQTIDSFTCVVLKREYYGLKIALKNQINNLAGVFKAKM